MSEKVIDESKIVIRPIQKEDIDDVVRVANLAFGIPGVAYKKEHYENHIAVFPEGQLVVLYDGEYVGSCSSVILDYDKYGDDHTFEDVSIGGRIDQNHTYDGDTLYGLDVVVHPDYRKLKLGARLYEERRRICREFNLKRIVIGGRMPNYHKYADKLSPEEYLEEVLKGEIYDPVIRFQTKQGFVPKRVQPNYLKGDKESLEYAVIMEWKNDQYDPNKK